MNPWVLAYDGFDAATEGRREALCTLGNGYFATRGAAPESPAGGVHYPGTYAAGCYNRLRSDVGGHTVENESLVNLPNWLALTFRIGDGPWFEPGAVDLLGYHQELDLHRGILTRMLRFRDGQGRTTSVTQRRFVHMEFRHLAGLETTILAEDWSGRLDVRCALDGTVENTGVARYRPLGGRHLTPVRSEVLDDEAVLLVTETNQSLIRIAEAARTRVLHNGGHRPATRRVVEEPGWIAHHLTVEMPAGEAITVEKIVALCTSRDRAISNPEVEVADHLAWAGGFDTLLERHILAWSHLWSRFHVNLESHEETLRTLRLHTFHLLQTVSPHSADLDAGVPARGLHGEAYRGHIFWDELFIFPTLTLRLPAVAQALLGYRYRRLPRARRAAEESGYAGAMYPWQSGSDGREETQQLHLNPMSGRWLPDPTHRQRHVGIAVAYNTWQYYQATGDVEFLTHYGAEMILDIARFWASIATYDRARDRYVIGGVVGPDEFHTGYPGSPAVGIDNNAYTNIMAAWVLVRAFDVLALLPGRRRVELTETLGLLPEELDRWEDISRKMFVPYHDGIISQFEGYEGLEELDWEDYRARYGNIGRLDRILEAEGDTVNRYRVSKQADVLMLFYLLSPDELRAILERLGYPLEAETIPRMVGYYLARTSHGSTLSAVVHAWVLARAHPEQALEFFIGALESDVADVQGGTTPEGIHLAAMAGTFDLLQRGFAGVETRDDVLWVNPSWPAALGAAEFTIHYREQPLLLRLDGERHMRLTAGEGVGFSVRVACRGEFHELGASESIELTLAP